MDVKERVPNIFDSILRSCHQKQKRRVKKVKTVEIEGLSTERLQNDPSL